MSIHFSFPSKQVSTIIRPSTTAPIKRTIKIKANKDDKAHDIELESSIVNNLKANYISKKEDIERYKDEISRLFKKSNSKESELKKYIAGLNSKVLDVNTQFDDRIDETHNRIMNMISEIQDKIKMEINYTKKEMEKEVLNRFMEAETKQQKLMNEKIEEQKKVIQKMNITRSEIDKIRKHFEDTNIKCEYLYKENETLRVNFQSLKEDNFSLKNKLKSLQKECKNLMEDNSTLFTNEDMNNMFEVNLDDRSISMDGSRELESIFNEKNVGESENSQNINLYSNTNTPFKDLYMPDVNKNSEIGMRIKTNASADDAEDIIKSLRSDIKKTKKEHKLMYRNYVEDLKNRNEAQQLLQKCIEDLKLDLNKTTKDINSLMKLQLKKKGLDKKLEEQIYVKNSHCASLENKLRILTFVYDNGFSTVKKQKMLVNKKII